MRKDQPAKWQKLTITPEEVMSKLEPGMNIFLGTGVGEPRTLVKHLMAHHSSNLKDLELIQLVSLGDAISVEALNSNAYRLENLLFRMGGQRSHYSRAGGSDSEQFFENTPVNRIGQNPHRCGFCSDYTTQ